MKPSARRFLAESLLVPLLRPLVRLLFRARVRGLGNLHDAGPRRVLIANHCGYLDALLLALLLPCRISFAMSSVAARRWWGRPARWLADVHEIDPENPHALRTLANLAREGRTVLIFPEGRLSSTGRLMKTYPGALRVASWADAAVVPLWLGGFERLPFTRRGTALRTAWFPRLTITVDAPVAPDATSRLDAGELLRAASVAAALERTSIVDAVIEGILSRGADRVVVDDHTQEPVTGRALLARSLALGRMLARETEVGERVGLLLPGCTGALSAVLGLMAHHRVPALLNPGSGFEALAACVEAASVRTVWTSRAFAGKVDLDQRLHGLRALGVRIRFLDTDLAPRAADRLLGLLATVAPRGAARLARAGRGGADSEAVVLFTSGSSGEPKGVVLSHGNLIAQAAQVLASGDITPTDRVFNALPLFHAFGLTCGTLAPLIGAASVQFHPSPLDYARIPEAVYRSDSTVLLGTNTFLQGWARRASAADFRAVRFVVAGAEPVQPAVRTLYLERFGLRILEGYGCTECAPVISLNTLAKDCPGTVGTTVPCLEVRLEPVEGLGEGNTGRLLVRGRNVMLGYLRRSQPGAVEAPRDGWHDTGDIVERLADGTLRIRGRAARFAKVGGEMISLAAVEAFIARVSPEAGHCVVARPHPARGEELVLVTEDETLTRQRLAAAAAGGVVPEIWIPREVLACPRLPRLPTGKLDLTGVKSLLREGTEAVAA